MSHTKGPWIFTEGKMPAISDSSGIPVAMQCRRNKEGEGKANAQLIAAAPELLEALELVLERYCHEVNEDETSWHNPENDDCVIAARAAIAKTKGE